MHDKATRSRAFQALASMGKVMVLAEAPWRAELLGQLTRFPAGRFDDGVDVCSLFGRGLEVLPPALSSALSPSCRSTAPRQHLIEYDPMAAMWRRDRDSGGGTGAFDYDHRPDELRDSERRPLDRSRFTDQIEALKRRTMLGG